MGRCKLINMNSPYKIACVGLWHLGETYSIGLAELGHRVVGISDDLRIVENFSKRVLPLAEPNLAEILGKNMDAGRLKYTTDYGAVAECNVVWITFDTPVDDNDSVDTSVIYDALEDTAPHLRDGVLIVATSQLPVGSAISIKKFIREKRPDLKFDYAYSPENLRLGEAVKCFFHPDRIVVGADRDEVFQKTEEIFYGLKTDFLRMSSVSAEMSKHALNAYLATSVSFINDIADVCEEVGADVSDVVRALRSDPRVGQYAFLNPGTGFSGGTLGRDLKALLGAAKQRNVALPVIGATVEKNDSRKEKIVRRLEEIAGGLLGKNVAIFGLSYKAGTPTLRRSRSLEIAMMCREKGATVVLHDPCADEDELSAKFPGAKFYRDPYKTAEGAAIILFITPWPEFLKLDFDRLRALAPDAFVFDASNFWAGKEYAIRQAGFNYYGIGRSGVGVVNNQ